MGDCIKITEVITVNELEELINAYISSLFLQKKEVDFSEKLNIYNNLHFESSATIHNFNNINDLIINNLHNISLKGIPDSDYFTIRYVLLLRERLKIKLIELNEKKFDNKIDIVEIDLSIIKNKLDLNTIKRLADNIIQMLKDQDKNEQNDMQLLITNIQRINIEKFINNTNFLDKYFEKSPTRPLIYKKYIFPNLKEPRETCNISKRSPPNITPLDIRNMATKYVNKILDINWIIDNIFNFYTKSDLFDFCYSDATNIVGYFCINKYEKLEEMSIRHDYDFFFIKFILYIRDKLKEELNNSHTVETISRFDREKMKKKIQYYKNNQKYQDYDEYDFDLEIKIKIKDTLDDIKLRLKNDPENLIIEYNNIKNLNIYIFLNLTKDIEDKFSILEDRSFYLQEDRIVFL